MGSVWVLADRCKGCGTCIDIYPENVFEIKDMDGRNVSVPIAEESCFTNRVCQVRCLRTRWD